MKEYVCTLSEQKRVAAVAATPTETARVAKLVDALVSGARAARHGGSSPFPGTTGNSAMDYPFVIYDLPARRSL